MPGDPNECRVHAKRCLELAAQSAYPPLKQNIIEVAHIWLRLAAEVEATNHLLRVWGGPRVVDN
jgi:hypothetical protein